MTARVRPMRIEDAEAVAGLSAKFAGYLRGLGDTGDHNLTAEAIRRDGFGPQAAFAGLVATGDNGLAGYLLYHLGYDADMAARNLHVIDLYVSSAARRKGAGRALTHAPASWAGGSAAASICRQAGGAYLFWAVYVPNQLAADFYTALGARYVQDLDFMVIAAKAL